MVRKITVAIFDNDLKCEVKKCKVSTDGTKISILSGGEGHFMPTFDNDSFLELPTRKKFLLFGDQIYKRYYIVKKKAKACVNFKTEEVAGPDLEQLKTALASASLDKLGKQEPPFPVSIIYIILLAVLGIAAKVFGVI